AASLFLFLPPSPSPSSPLSLHDALPISFHVPWNWLSYIVPIQFSGSMKYALTQWIHMSGVVSGLFVVDDSACHVCVTTFTFRPRSEEHTSELQSRGHLVCRLLLEKKKKN